MQPNGMRFSMTLDHYPDAVIPSQHRDVALYLKRQFSQIGIDARIRKSKNFPEWFERIGNWDFDITLDTQYNWGDPVIGVHRTYISENIRKGVPWSNTQNYRSARVDELLQLAEKELDTNTRKTFYSEFQKIVAEELPVIWTNIIPFYNVYHKGLGNLPLSIWGVHSPLDELYWKKQPTRQYVSPPGLTDTHQISQLQKVGMKAILLLRKKGFYQALNVFSDPRRGFLDLENSGLHIIGLTGKGFVFLDNSGQTKRGMNIGRLLDLEGNRVIDKFLHAAQETDGGFVSFKGGWPHPKTHKVGSMSAWCGKLAEADIICAMKWEESAGDGK